MLRTFIEVTVAAEEELREQLVGLLSQIGFEGFWEEAGALRGYIDRTRWTPALQEEVERLVRLAVRPSSDARRGISVAALEDRNWNAEWERTIRPIHVTGRIVITPTWQDYRPAPGELVLTIDPKMSFGTGYHESTRLMLRLMERHLRPGDTVLDVGTGTGVLAIAAVKLGATSATGTDIDAWATENATENVALNGVADRVTIHAGDLAGLKPDRYTLLLANIQRQILQALMPLFMERLAPDGRMILAGLLAADEPAMLHTLREAGCEVMEQLSENEWIAITAHKR